MVQIPAASVDPISAASSAEPMPPRWCAGSTLPLRTSSN
jgi:hypothetical protein